MLTHQRRYDTPRSRCLPRPLGGRQTSIQRTATGLATVLLAVAGGAPSTRAGLQWTQIAPSGPTPVPRMAHAAIYDAPRHRLVVFGGHGTELLNDVWALSLDGKPIWTQLHPDGTPPPPRWDHTAVYDPDGDRMLVFGGEDPTWPPNNDLWALSLGDSPQWTLLTPEGAPPARRVSHSAAFDAAHHRMLVFGGHDGFALLGDAWELTTQPTLRWTQLAPPDTGPKSRRDAVGLFDPLRTRLVIHGGNAGVAPFQDDTWTLDVAGPSSWNELEPPGALPSGPITHAAIHDPLRDRLVVFGGSYHSETWALRLDGTQPWAQLQPVGALPPGRIDHTTVYDLAGDRLIAFGGHTGLALLGDVWALRLEEATSAPASRAGARLGVAIRSKLPAAGEVLLELSLPRAGYTMLTVFDVRGRIVARPLVRDLEPGVHAVRWDARDVAGGRVAAGVYYCELRSGTDRTSVDIPVGRR